MSIIHLRVLGGVELTSPDGRDLASVLAQPKRLALLTYLALHHSRGFLRRDSLVATFWPALDDAHARGALSQALRFLRRGLDDRLIERRGEEELTLAPGILSCDAVNFERTCSSGDFEAALKIYRGPLLDGFFISDAPEFERWLDGERARLARAYAQGLEAEGERYAARGHHAEAAEYWRRRAECEPYNATVAQKFMLALAAVGDRAGAIGHASEHEQRLAELEAQPDPAVAALAERLRGTQQADPPRGNVPSSRAESTPHGAFDEPQTVLAAGGAVGSARETAPAGLLSEKSDARTRNHSARRRIFGSRTAWVGALAVAATLFAVLTSLRHAPRKASSSENRRVAVLPLENETGRSDLDFVGLEVQDWVTRGLQQTGLVRVFAAPPTGTVPTPSGDGDPLESNARFWMGRVGVGTLIGGRYYLRGDSILIQVSVTAIADGKVIATPNPVIASISDPTAAIDTLRQRTIGALAAYLDPALTEWATFASQPPSFEAYREFSQGQQAFNRDDYDGAVVHYLRAAALDSGYVYPLLMAAQLRSVVQSSEFPTRDSLLRIVRARHQRLQPFDAALASEVEAEVAGDFERRLDAAQELRKYVAPGSTWDLDAVNTAIALNRPREAMAIVRGIDLHREAALNHWSVFIDIGNAYHLAGDNVALLHLMRNEGRKWQYGPLIVVFQMQALAALSRPAEVDSMWRTLLERKDGEGVAGAIWAAVQGAFELRAHGFPAEARRLAQEALDSLPTVPSTSKKFDDPLIWKMHALQLAGRAREALPIAQAIIARSPGRVQMQALTAVLAAQLGDTAMARDVDARLAVLSGSPDYVRSAQLARARIAASLGKPDTAVALLHAACDYGCAFMETIHATPGLEGLRTYRPFLEFLRSRG